MLTTRCLLTPSPGPGSPRTGPRLQLQPPSLTRHKPSCPHPGLCLQPPLPTKGAHSALLGICTFLHFPGRRTDSWLCQEMGLEGSAQAGHSPANQHSPCAPEEKTQNHTQTQNRKQTHSQTQTPVAAAQGNLSSQLISHALETLPLAGITSITHALVPGRESQPLPLDYAWTERTALCQSFAKVSHWEGRSLDSSHTACPPALCDSCNGLYSFLSAIKCFKHQKVSPTLLFTADGVCFESCLVLKLGR